jgi:hypothetical protein
MAVSSGDRSPPLDDLEIDIIGGKYACGRMLRTVKVLTTEINGEYLMIDTVYCTWMRCIGV